MRDRTTLELTEQLRLHVSDTVTEADIQKAIADFDRHRRWFRDWCDIGGSAALSTFVVMAVFNGTVSGWITWPLIITSILLIARATPGVFTRR